jgi:ubiquinone/menaquinone biosynthesis C-methylase UbiE/uncharacterized protein YbaR (Trm112 family)
MTWLWILLLVAGLLALLYWQLIVAEGTYLGSRVVAWTYDLVAGRYDAIKQFQPRDESWFIAGPVLQGLQELERPLVLDVATGTGRLPLALLNNHFRGQILGLDLSRGMLRRAWAKLRPFGEQVCLVWQDAARLPFDDDSFDAVTCLESLEFMPRPGEVLAEMVRVLAPGGVLFVTNRVGREARWLPARAMSRPRFVQTLVALSLDDIQVRPWQVNYDLAVARKAGQQAARGQGDGDLAARLRCPGCAATLQRGVAKLSCPACGCSYPIREGLVHLAVLKKRDES